MSDLLSSALAPQRRSLGRFLAIAASLALISGLLEGLLTWALTAWPGILSWKTGNSVKVLFAAPLVYLILFIPAALPFAILGRIWNPDWAESAMVWSFLGLSFFSAATLMGSWFSGIAALLLGLGLASVLTRAYSADRSRWGETLRRAWPRLAGVALAVALIGNGLAAIRERLAVRSLPPAPAAAPNVLLIVMDTQRADHLTPYGYPRATTPRLGQLAADGVRFAWATSPAATTLPSHSSMMTGRLVNEHGAGVNSRLFLDRRFPTLAERLRASGYLTGGFIANTYWTGRHTGINRGFVHYEDFYSSPMDGFTRTVLGRALAYRVAPLLGLVDIPGRKHAGEVDRELLAWLDGNSGRPFFAFLNYFDVHAPYRPPAGFAGRFSAGGDSVASTHKIEIGAWNEGTVPDSAVMAVWRNRYDESLAYLDHEIGALLDSLAARHLLENTIVIVTGDHGESFGEHGTVHHGGTLYLEQIRVPLIVWGPGRIPGGRIVEQPVDLRAIPNTVLEAAGLPASGFPAPSLLSHLGSSDSLSSAAISEGPRVPGNPPTWQTGKGWVKSALGAGWHLIELQSGERQLYDLGSDPGELHNLAGSPEAREVQTRLEGKLEAVPTAVAAESGPR